MPINERCPDVERATSTTTISPEIWLKTTQTSQMRPPDIIQCVFPSVCLKHRPRQLDLNSYQNTISGLGGRVLLRTVVRSARCGCDAEVPTGCRNRKKDGSSVIRKWPLRWIGPLSVRLNGENFPFKLSDLIWAAQAEAAPSKSGRLHYCFGTRRAFFLAGEKY